MELYKSLMISFYILVITINKKEHDHLYLQDTLNVIPLLAIILELSVQNSQVSIIRLLFSV